MIAAIDVQYFEHEAQSGLVLFDKWDSDSAIETDSKKFNEFKPYEPGSFFLRELPLITAALADHLNSIETVLIDAYVDLDSSGQPGLGRRLFDHYGGSKIIIGVAKSRFRDTQHAMEVLRGDSERALFVTAAGMENQKAADCIRSMHGDFRLPSMIKEADTLARNRLN